MKCGHSRRDVRREVGREIFLFYPPVPVAVRLERLGGLRHGLLDRRTALAFIERKCGDVDKRSHFWMIAGLGDDGPTVTVSDDNHWPVHGVESRLGVLLVIGVGGLRFLQHRHRVSIFLEELRDRFPAGPVSKCSMHQEDVVYASRRRDSSGRPPASRLVPISAAMSAKMP
jgi:hypothetical protein